jgi:hypothetical protein
MLLAKLRTQPGFFDDLPIDLALHQFACLPLFARKFEPVIPEHLSRWAPSNLRLLQLRPSLEASWCASVIDTDIGYANLLSGRWPRRARRSSEPAASKRTSFKPTAILLLVLAQVLLIKGTAWLIYLLLHAIAAHGVYNAIHDIASQTYATTSSAPTATLPALKEPVCPAPVRLRRLLLIATWLAVSVTSRPVPWWHSGENALGRSRSSCEDGDSVETRNKGLAKPQLAFQDDCHQHIDRTTKPVRIQGLAANKNVVVKPSTLPGAVQDCPLSRSNQLHHGRRNLRSTRQ